jgi:hypothetical protein
VAKGGRERPRILFREGIARRRRPGRAALAFCILALSALVRPAVGGVQAGRGSGESLIDESSPDESLSAPGRTGSPVALSERLREYVEGSLARYDALKSESAGFRRQGWFPSLFLRDPERDVVLEPGPAGTTAVTVHVSCARRDLEQRLVIAPAERFELPGADRRFFAEVLGALATAAPEVGHARLRFWFAVLRADGRMTWESRGGIGLSSAAARRFPAGSRTAEAVWPLLDENTLPPSAWDGP